MSEEEIGGVEALCIVFHDAYEAAAIDVGWETQERSRKPWADVPEANKATMRATIAHVLASDWLVEHDAKIVGETLRSVARNMIADFALGRGDDGTTAAAMTADEHIEAILTGCYGVVPQAMRAALTEARTALRVVLRDQR